MIHKRIRKINSNTKDSHQTTREENKRKREEKKKNKNKSKTVNKMAIRTYLICIYRTLHPKAAEYTFFSSGHGTFCKTDHILGHKSSLGNFKKTEIISSVFSDHNAIQLEINKKKLQKTQLRGD